MKIGGYLRQKRLSQHKSLQDVANPTGYSRTYIWEIERGNKPPSFEALARISKDLGIENEMPLLDYAADVITRMAFLSVKKRKALITALYKEEA